MFFQSGFSFTAIHESQDCMGRERGGHFFNSSLLLPPASQTLRHLPGDYRRQLTPVHRQQPDSNREPLVSKCKSLTTKLRALVFFVTKTGDLCLYLVLLVFLGVFHQRCAIKLIINVFVSTVRDIVAKNCHQS